MNKMYKNNSRIVCAAILMDDGSVITGVRHASPLMRLTMEKIYGKNYHKKVEKQGFVDQYENFISREESWSIAKKQKQIIRPTGFESVLENQPEDLEDRGMLFSENLY